ncbi:MAG TPA: hypothetical protein VJZ49_09770 [Syntrophales bacterium]|nr:hypothetical protein [Syntrophales bacterium]
MKDEEKTKEQLINELDELRKQVADLSQYSAERKQMEIELLNKNHECLELTSELEQKYREIKWHDEIQMKYLGEVEQKKILLEYYIRLLKRKTITSRILAFVLVIIVVCIGIAASLGKTAQFIKSFYEYDDLSYRPMDIERQGHPLPLKTGKVPGKL